jgi:3',5'-cyclic AMP phosphodiesterase CpdA
MLRKLCSVWVLSCAFLFAQPSRSFFFIQLADPQFGMMPLQKDFHKERQNLARAVEAINRLRPDFVVVCGDLVNSPGNPLQIAAFRQTIASMDTSIPLYLVPGNHDVGNTPTPATLETYQKEFGKDYYSFVRHGTTFVVLNTSVLKNAKKVPIEASKQRTWIAKTLDEAREKHVRVIVFQHHPWFLKDADERDSYFNMPRWVRNKFLPSFDSSGVVSVYAGHLHSNAAGTYRRLKMITSGPVGMPLGFDPSGIRIVIVHPTSIEDKYYSLKRIPAKVELGEAKAK